MDGQKLVLLNLSGIGEWNGSQLVSIKIDLSGEIIGFYRSGDSKKLGLIALALFQNQRKLDRLGDHCLQPTDRSGNPYIDFAQTDGRGSIYASSLEEIDSQVYEMALDSE